MALNSIASVILGSSFIAALVSQLLQNRNWLIQKKLEQKLEIANSFLKAISEYDNSSRTDRNQAAQSALSQIALLSIAEVIFDRKEISDLISSYLVPFGSVISHGLDHDDGVMMARRRNSLAAALYAEAYGVERSKVKKIRDHVLLSEAIYNEIAKRFPDGKL